MENKENIYPEGHFLGLWMGIGDPGFIGIGPAIGISFGLAIGQAIENKHKQEGKIRPLTESEIKRRKKTITAGIIILAFGVLMFISVYFLRI